MDPEQTTSAKERELIAENRNNSKITQFFWRNLNTLQPCKLDMKVRLRFCWTCLSTMSLKEKSNTLCGSIAYTLGPLEDSRSTLSSVLRAVWLKKIPFKTLQILCEDNKHERLL